MSIKDYTNEELLLEFSMVSYYLRAEIAFFGKGKPYSVEDYNRFKAEVLERMSASNGNNK